MMLDSSREAQPLLEFGWVQAETLIDPPTRIRFQLFQSPTHRLGMYMCVQVGTIAPKQNATYTRGGKSKLVAPSRRMIEADSDTEYIPPVTRISPLYPTLLRTKPNSSGDILVSIEPAPKANESNKWCIAGQFQLYQNDTMLNNHRRMTQTVTVELKVLTGSLHTAPAIQELFRRHKFEWMARSLRTYSEAMTRDFYASYAATVLNSISKWAKPAAQPPLQSILPWMQRSIAEFEARMEQMMDQKFQAVHKHLDVFDLRVLERSTLTIDVTAFQTELASLRADVAALLGPVEKVPEFAPTVREDEVAMTSLLGDTMPPPNSSRVVSIVIGCLMRPRIWTSTSFGMMPTLLHLGKSHKLSPSPKTGDTDGHFASTYEGMDAAFYCGVRGEDGTNDGPEVLGPVEKVPKSTPAVPEDEVAMTSLFGDTMPPPNSSRAAGKRHCSDHTSDTEEA
uniref:Integrase core domain containing protein n=1 Tax=Solanum tuberosum TaxID=4113 RepID=M1DUW8_SOLTU